MAANILVVDDSRSMRKLVRAALEVDGHRVSEGENGHEALDLLDSGPVDLVIADVNMPVMDGITLTKEIRTRARHRFTPVLILTTERGEDMKQRGRSAGATGWLVKPFDPAQLRQVVHRVIGTPKATA